MVRPDALAGRLGGDGAERRFIQAGDGVDLHYLRWSSGSAPARTAVIFLHGIASQRLVRRDGRRPLGAGRGGLCPDRRGSGRSGGPRGHLTRYERALDDVEAVVRLVADEHRGTPVFLAAWSWAAKLAVVYAELRPHRSPA